jgi:hypothetical protein
VSSRWSRFGSGARVSPGIVASDRIAS